MIKIKRAYDTPGKQDGYRVLVDRIWPRGLKKEEAVIDRWLKEVAPSTELRRWFGHESKKWPEFCKRYAAELENKTDAIQFLLEQGRNGTLTLIYAARNTEHNNAVVLKSFLESSLTGGSRE